MPGIQQLLEKLQERAEFANIDAKEGEAAVFLANGILDILPAEPLTISLELLKILATFATNKTPAELVLLLPQHFPYVPHSLSETEIEGLRSQAMTAHIHALLQEMHDHYILSHTNRRAWIAASEVALTLLERLHKFYRPNTKIPITNEHLITLIIMTGNLEQDAPPDTKPQIKYMKADEVANILRQYFDHPTCHFLSLPLHITDIRANTVQAILQAVTKQLVQLETVAAQAKHGLAAELARDILLFAPPKLRISATCNQLTQLMCYGGTSYRTPERLALKLITRFQNDAFFRSYDPNRLVTLIKAQQHGIALLQFASKLVGEVENKVKAAGIEDVCRTINFVRMPGTDPHQQMVLFAQRLQQDPTAMPSRNEIDTIGHVIHQALHFIAQRKARTNNPHNLGSWAAHMPTADGDVQQQGAPAMGGSSYIV
jgi:hypothetical protein